MGKGRRPGLIGLAVGVFRDTSYFNTGGMDKREGGSQGAQLRDGQGEDRVRGEKGQDGQTQARQEARETQMQLLGGSQSVADAEPLSEQRLVSLRLAHPLTHSPTHQPSGRLRF